ncbi:uncharacterized protein Triagg1_6677 [Trichoderma aggressivum f. europaeum]|uniref:PTM1-like N-terminal domain-containing protein n=1 Tax=Trichoderma aggressivum f. europaeum TaxID=173218 RepID=A0AAE1LYE3_9HYPO|nr:hypothetical protein Triagg1_6677 [Trichoderma aggressivum f. europaeum]
MNGDQAFQPSTASSLVVTFDAAAEGSVSVVVFELGDEHLGGIHLPGTQDKEIFCNSQNVERKLCKESEIGQFLISDHARAKAKYPMITRAIDLTKPIAIVYPVQGPGYFCAATYSQSAKSYSGTLLAIDTNGILPAFRDGSRAIYTFLAPFWFLLNSIWVYFVTHRALTQLIDPFKAVLGTLSIAQVGFRWGYVQLEESKAASTLQILWYTLELTQNSLVMFIIHKLVTGSEASPPDSMRSKIVRRIIPYAYLAIFLAIFVLASLADFTATAESIRPAIVTIFLGIYLFVGAAAAAFMLARRRTTTHEHQGGFSTEDKLIRKPLSFVLAALCIPIIAIAGFNIWAILKVGGDGAKFAHMFWHSRFGVIDMPYEPLFLILVMVVAGLSTYQAHRHDEMADMTSMETDGLMTYKPVSMDSSELVEEEREEK